MAKEKKPAFQWYPKDFLSDEHVITMTMAQRGIYISLLSLCWLHETIPNNPVSAARLCGATPKEMATNWGAVSARFLEDPADHTRLRHKRLDAERAKQAEHSEAKRESGKKGADARWHGDGKAMASANILPSMDDSKAMAHARTPAADGNGNGDGDKKEKEEVRQNGNGGNPLYGKYADLVAAWPEPTDVEFGLQAWISLVDHGDITEQNIADIFAGLERWKNSQMWARGVKHDVSTWLGFGKFGKPAGKRWLDYPAQVGRLQVPDDGEVHY